MRIARLVGLSQDGRSLIVATPSGEELAVPVDERLHAALRGDQPRLGQLEIEMENALGPRDIQSRIRAGQSVEEVGRVAGIPLDRVERFAAPVLAEREHVALVAMSSSVRRRGETSGHRLLRLAVTERLAKRGVDIDSVNWDAYRREDGRWSVSAEYRSGEATRQALFVFDLQGRFSVADNDEARWVLGEQSSVKGPQPGRRRPVTDGEAEPDTEPTLDLSDELALVRVIQPPETDPSGTQSTGDGSPVAEEPSTAVDRMATVRDLYPVPDPVGADDPNVDPTEAGAEADTDAPGQQVEDERESALEALATLLDQAQDTGAIYRGLSDASAVPDVDNSGWEPGIVVDYPVEPSPEPPEAADADERAESTPAEPEPEQAEPAQAEPESTEPEPAEPEPASAEREAPEAGPATDEPNAEEPARAPVTGEAASGESAEPDQSKPARAAGKRKRAAVPSWDEIMFGGPPRSR